MPSRIPPLALAVVLAASGTASLFAQAPSGKNLLIEAEEFQMQSNWFVLQQGECSNKQGLQAGSGQLDALTGVTVPEAGAYTVWTRARDFETQQPGTRRYKVILDNEPVGVEAGVHGKEGWRWEKLGTREIAAGDHVLGLRAVTSFARCDAILLTTGDYDPNTVPVRSLARYHIQPKVLNVNDLKEEFLNPPITTRSRRPVGRIGNDRVRIAFSEAEDSAGRTLITRATELFQNGKWERVPVKENQEALMLIYSAKSAVSTGNWYPFWSNGRKIEFEFGGKKYVTAAGGNPYKAGEVEVLIPRNASVKKGGAIEVGYETASGRKATGVWSVEPGRLDAKLQVTFTADKKGEYSVAFSPFQSWDKEAVAYNFLPPLFNYQRLPAEPKMSVSATMPHALALVETGSAAKYTYGVLADPARLPFDWPSPHNSTYGFSLQTSANKVQPTVFQPILGFEDSKLKPGESKTVSLSVLVQPGDWKAALEYASNQVFNVTDYRRPYGTSLTDAALNMIDLLKDEDHCGWDPKVKGFYNIESQWTASQSSPLAVMSAALLTWDEDLWVKRALPSLEYTLTRPGAHFATKLPKTSPSYVDEKGIKIRVPSDFFGAAYWQGVDDLLGRKNPWTAQYATENGKARYRSSYGSVPRWSEMLGLYRLDPKPELLDQIKKQADTFLKEDVYGRKTNDLGLEPFYNVSFYPYWWDLVDLYEVTHESRYLEAAQEGAFNTIAGLWSQPAVPKSNVTVNPGGDVPAKFTIQWYKGDEKYRLGFPRATGDLKEHEVPGWLISRVGLGFEQPCTYYAGGGATFNNIMMSAWAPNLLRVYGYTHREIINTYARNTIIGRFANYPGYYLRVYTDVQTTPQYPYQGPDLTSLYYHHIPVHLAFTLDYLVAEASVRSKGKIDFPWVKQQGYVWFTNRIYGHAPGKIYGDDKMWLRFDRKAIQVKSDQLTYLSAFGANRFDLVLMNESDAPVTSDILLDTTKLGLKEGAPCRVIVNGGEPQSAAFNGKAEVPAKGLVVLSFQATGKNVPPEIPVLKTEPVTQKLSGDWGTLHAFRIRSPFGKDSLYTVLSGHPANGATARLELEGQSEPVPAVDSYPYEFTVYPWPMDRDMTFHVVCKDASGTETSSAPITLKP